MRYFYNRRNARRDARRTLQEKVQSTLLTAGFKTFKQTPENTKTTKTLAANQGLYNGFLAAGLLWGLSLGTAGFAIKVFFLLSVLIAGLYGAATVGKKILFIQALPAAVALLLLCAV